MLKKVFLFCIFIFAPSLLADNAKALEKNLYRHVDYLSSITPARESEYPHLLDKAAAYIQKEFQANGLPVEIQTFDAGGNSYHNVIARYGRENLPVVVVGAHYDVCDTRRLHDDGNVPGADDNASGVAALLELSRMVAQNHPRLNYRIEFVAYSLEEPPYYSTNRMGSYVHARSLAANRVKVKLMLSLEMLGYYSDKRGSQDYPTPLLKPFYPDTGNFIALVGRFQESWWLGKVRRKMRARSPMPVETLAAPPSLTGVDFSDHRNYWSHGFPAIMVTDTAFYRNKKYHTRFDTIDRLNFEKMAQVVAGLYGALIGL